MPRAAAMFHRERLFPALADEPMPRVAKQFRTHCQLIAIGPVGFAATGTGASIALFVMAIKWLTGPPVFFAHDSLVMLSTVLIETGVVLLGLGLLGDVPSRICGDSGQRREQ
jgi:hypothetical protein